MSAFDDIRAWWRRLDPTVVDVALAVGLTLVVCVQVWLFADVRPERLVPQIPNLRAQPPANPRVMLAYFWVALTFLPLALRRHVPWLALAASGTGALLYSLHPLFPPAPVVFGPMIALYTVAAYASRRHAGLIALLVAGIVAAVGLFTFSSSVRWVAELVGMFVMLAAAALLGEAERTRRDYVAEYRRRAEAAERSREEEARRRVDEERIRIARDVHDVVAHSLSIVTVQSGAALAQLDSDPDGARESIRHVRSTSKQALTELRAMLDVLRTGDADEPREPTSDLGRLEALVDSVRDTDLDVALEVAGDLTRVPAYAAVSAYRIVQEALTNIVRHADADTARVDVLVGDDVLDVRVSDDGRASLPSDPGASGGHGVRGMRERVEALGGSFDIAARSGGGALVHATIPLRRSS